MRKVYKKFKYVIIAAIAVVLLCFTAVALAGCQSKAELEAELDAAMLNVMDNERLTMTMSTVVAVDDEEQSAKTTIRRTVLGGEETIHTYMKEDDYNYHEEYIKWDHAFSYDRHIAKNEDDLEYYSFALYPVKGDEDANYNVGGLNYDMLLSLDESAVDYSISKSKKGGQNVYKIVMGLERAFDAIASSAGLSEIREYINFDKKVNCYCYVDASTEMLTKISMSFGFRVKSSVGLPKTSLDGKEVSITLDIDFVPGGDFIIGSTTEMDKFGTALTDSNRVIHEEYYGENGHADRITKNNQHPALDYYKVSKNSNGGTFTYGYDKASGFAYVHGDAAEYGKYEVNVFDDNAMKKRFSAKYDTHIQKVMFTRDEMMVVTSPYWFNNATIDQYAPKKYRIFGYSLKDFSRTTDITIDAGKIDSVFSVHFYCFDGKIFYVGTNGDIMSYDRTTKNTVNTNLNFRDEYSYWLWYDSSGDLLYFLINEAGADYILSQYNGTTHAKIKTVAAESNYLLYTFDGEYLHYDHYTINKNLEYIKDDIPDTVYPPINYSDFSGVLCYGTNYDIVRVGSFTYIYSHKTANYVQNLSLSSVLDAKQLSDGRFFLYMGTECAFVDVADL